MKGDSYSWTNLDSPSTTSSVNLFDFQVIKNLFNSGDPILIMNKLN